MAYIFYDKAKNILTIVEECLGLIFNICVLTLYYVNDVIKSIPY